MRRSEWSFFFAGLAFYGLGNGLEVFSRCGEIHTHYFLRESIRWYLPHCCPLCSYYRVVTAPGFGAREVCVLTFRQEHLFKTTMQRTQEPLYHSMLAEPFHPSAPPTPGSLSSPSPKGHSSSRQPRLPFAFSSPSREQLGHGSYSYGAER